MSKECKNTKLANKIGQVSAGFVDQICFLPQATFRTPEDFGLEGNQQIRLSDSFQLDQSKHIYHMVVGFVDHGYYDDMMIVICLQVHPKARKRPEIL